MKLGAQAFDEVLAKSWVNANKVVLGHEIAYAVVRHGAERMSEAMVTETGGALLGALLGKSPGANALLAAYRAGAQVGVLLPYGRAQESKADHIGMLPVARRRGSARSDRILAAHGARRWREYAGISFDASERHA